MERGVALIRDGRCLRYAKHLRHRPLVSLQVRSGDEGVLDVRTNPSTHGTSSHSPRVASVLTSVEYPMGWYDPVGLSSYSSNCYGDKREYRAHKLNVCTTGVLVYIVHAISFVQVYILHKDEKLAFTISPVYSTTILDC